MLAAVVALAYAPALHAPLLFDDVNSIDGNPSIRKVWPPSEALRPPPALAVTGRPVANYSLAVSYALNAALTGEAADVAIHRGTIGHHLLNLALHIGCGALLLAIARRTIRHQRYDRRLARSADHLAFALTSLWLLHPLQTEAVNYVVQRTELLASFFLLSTLYAWIRGWEAGTGRKRAAWRAVAVAACLLGMGSKEVMAVAPLVVLAYDRAFRVESWSALFRRARHADDRDAPRPWFYIALLATPLPLAAIIASNPRAGTVGFGKGMAWYEYLYTQAWAIGHYVRLTLFPVGQSIDYGQDPVRGLAGVPGLLLLTGLGGLTLMAWRRAATLGWLAFLGTAFFFILAPSSSFVPILTEIAAERRFYLPLAVVLAGALAGLRWALLRWRNVGDDSPLTRRICYGAIALSAVLLAPLTAQRSRMYAEPEALYRQAIEKAPRNVRAYGNLAAMFEWEGTRRAEAIELYRAALAIDSNYAFAWFRLAEMAIADRRFDEAAELLQAILRKDPANATANARLGFVIGTVAGPEEAIPYLERAASVDATPQTLADLGHMYAAAGRLIEAVDVLARALEIDPTRAAARSYLGFVLIGLGHSADAIPHLQEASRRDPNSAITRARLALAYADSDRRPQAFAEAAKALDLAGDEARVFSLAGMALSRAGYLDEARQVLTRAVEMDPDDIAARAELEELRRRN